MKTISADTDYGCSKPVHSSFILSLTLFIAHKSYERGNKQKTLTAKPDGKVCVLTLQQIKRIFYNVLTDLICIGLFWK